MNGISRHHTDQYLMDNLLQIIFYVGAVQGFLLAIGLLTLETNKNSNRILSLLTGIWGLVLLVYALQADDFYLNNPHFLLVFDQLILLIFPLFYLYARYLLSNAVTYNRGDLWHFLPFLASIVAHSNFFLQNGEDKLNLVRNPTDYLAGLEIVNNEVVSVQSIIYPVLILMLVNRYKKALKDQSSSLIKRRIHLLQIGVFVVLLFWSVSVVCLHLTYFGVSINFDFYSTSYLSLVLLIYIISYVSFRRTEVFKVEFSPKESRTSLMYSTRAGAINKESQHTKPLTEPIANDHVKALDWQLENAMQKDKLYLNPDLSLRDLADHLGVSRNELSGLINSQHKQNFYEFVNSYRVEEVKNLMSDPANKDLKMESFGYSAGFNSKASFYRIFKQFTGKSPMQYFSGNYNSSEG